jgi:biopolymer transport protein ExbB
VRPLMRRLRSSLPALLTVAVLLVLVVGSAAFAQEAGDATGAQAPKENFLIWVAKCSGIIGLVILGLSIYFVATVIRLFLEIRQKVAAPPELIQACDDLITARDFRELYKVAKASDSFLGRILATGISELSNGLPEARDAMERASDAATVEMEKMISMLAVLGTLGPMIGLLGTLKGMIASFSVIAMSKGTAIKSDEVAGGISEALLLTFEGVLLSVPAIYFFALFRNRIATISSNTTLLADQMLRRIYHAAQAKPGAGAAAAPAQK